MWDLNRPNIPLQTHERSLAIHGEPHPKRGQGAPRQHLTLAKTNRQLSQVEKQPPGVGPAEITVTSNGFQSKSNEIFQREGQFIFTACHYALRNRPVWGERSLRLEETSKPRRLNLSAASLGRLG